ncbi:MAG: hypothetical protein H0T90_06705 [Gemmatimonadales bacterium]|nr:hypothetical protein [Gemmatimonadales bacterium]
MKTFWMLAAAATLAACGANQQEDEMGAAPDRGDTTAVTAGADTVMGADTSSWTGQTPNTEYGADTTAQTEASWDSTSTLPGATGDTTSMGDDGMTTDTTGMTSDTSAMGTDTSGTSGMTTDSSTVGHEPGNFEGDSALTEHDVPTGDSTQTQ